MKLKELEPMDVLVALQPILEKMVDVAGVDDLAYFAGWFDHLRLRIKYRLEDEAAPAGGQSCRD